MSRFVDYATEDAADLLISELESGAESEDLLKNLVPECVSEDSESSSENEVEQPKCRKTSNQAKTLFKVQNRTKD